MKTQLILAAFIAATLNASAQSFQWVTHSEQAVTNAFDPVATDPAGNIYALIGTNASGATVQGNAIPCVVPGADGVVIAKFDPNGNFVWGKMVNPNNGVIYPEKIAVDNDGNVYASITFPNSGDTHMADTVYQTSGYERIVKLNTNGSFVRERDFTSGSAPRISALGNDVYICNANNIMKLDSMLNTVWSVVDASGVLSFGASGSDRPDIFVQTNGELAVTAFETFNSIGDVPFGNDTVHLHVGDYNEAAIIKMDTSGNVLWTYALQVAGVPVPHSVAVDHQGNVYAGVLTTGSGQTVFANDTLNDASNNYETLLKWNSGGTPVWGLGLYSTSGAWRLHDLNINALNEILLTGSSGTFDINGNSFNPALTKIGPTKNFIWHKETNPNNSYVDGIAVRAGNEYIVAGSAVNPGTYQFDCIGVNSVADPNFIMLITEQPPVSPVADFNYTINGNAYTFNDQSQNASSWHWDFGDGDTSNVQNPTHTFTVGGDVTIILTVTNGLCIDADTLQLHNVGIDKAVTQQSVSIYPNPATDQIETSWTGTASELEIRDLLGNALVTKRVSPNASPLRLNIADLASGVYILELKSPKSNFCTKIVKQ